MRKFTTFAALGLAVAAGLSGCTNPYDPGQRAVGGGLIGAGAGAAIGAAAGAAEGPRSARRSAARPARLSGRDNYTAARVPAFSGIPTLPAAGLRSAPAAARL